ncbi:MAG TPA: CdvA-like protein, partial [Nitrososphaera sp.]|nr:CdvA-like protein [Nitrososphaera sp.]
NNIKAVLFDAKLQFRSNEMKEETYQQIKVQTDELIEHISNEKTEIGNVRTKLAANTLENIAAVTAPVVEPAKEEAPGAEPNPPAAEVAPQQVAAAGAEEEKPVAVSASGAEQSETSWLNQVITK